MKVFVTGGTGFLGGHIVDALIKEGNDVTCLVRNMNKAQRLEKLGVNIIVGNLLDKEILIPAMRGNNRIIHAAAMVSDWGPWEEFKLNTYEGTKNLLFAASKCNIEKFVHISTVDVYKKIAFMPDMPRISEDCELEDDFGYYYYGKAKLLAECAVWHYINAKKLNATIIRPATIYGPGDLITFPRLVDFLKSDSAGLIKHYNPVVGLVYVKDVANLCVQVMKSKIADGRIYNAASDEDIRLRQFLMTICCKLNIRIPNRIYKYWQLNLLANVFEQMGHIFRQKQPPIFTKVALRLFTFDQRFDISKAKRELNWIAETNFERGISATIDWFLNHKF